jgi:3-phenylpropionate/trans-cinnamate dioxygenase ferredoxin subunit
MMRSGFRALAQRLQAAGRRGGRYVVAGSADDLAVGEIRRVKGVPAVICRTTLQLYAVAVSCPHAGANLSKGRLVGDCLECPLHGARFVLGHDAAVDRQPSLRLRSYDVKVRDGMIYVSRRPRHQVYGGWEDSGPREVAGPASRAADAQGPMDGE